MLTTDGAIRLKERGKLSVWAFQILEPSAAAPRACMNRELEWMEGQGLEHKHSEMGCGHVTRCQMLVPAWQFCTLLVEYFLDCLSFGVLVFFFS